VGIVNLAVSFSLALLVALKARQVRFRYTRPLAAALGRRFLATPLDFFRPPRESSPTT
jgi:site-specific recombinase